MGASLSRATLEDNFGEKKIATPVTAPAVTDNRAFEILANWDVKTW